MEHQPLSLENLTIKKINEELKRIKLEENKVLKLKKTALEKKISETNDLNKRIINSLKVDWNRTQEWISHKSGIPTAKISRILNDKNIPGTNTIYAYRKKYRSNLQDSMTLQRVFNAYVKLDGKPILLFHKLWLWLAPLVLTLAAITFVTKYNLLNLEPSDIPENMIFFAYGCNIVVIVLLFIKVKDVKTARNPSLLKDENIALDIFIRAWKFALKCWGFMYGTLFFVNGFAKIYPTQENQLLTFKISSVLSNIFSGYNTAFLFWCFLVLFTARRFTVKNRQLRNTFKYGIILFSVITALGSIDALYQFNQSTDGIFEILYECTMAMVFILLCSRLQMSYWSKPARLLSMVGLVLYGTLMPYNALLHKDNMWFNTVVVLIYCAGKWWFGSEINGQIKRKTRDKSDLYTYIEKLYMYE